MRVRGEARKHDIEIYTPSVENLEYIALIVDHLALERNGEAQRIYYVEHIPGRSCTNIHLQSELDPSEIAQRLKEKIKRLSVFSLESRDSIEGNNSLDDCIVMLTGNKEEMDKIISYVKTHPTVR